MTSLPSVLRRQATALTHDKSGVAMVEFALGLPFFFGITAFGIEVANMAYSAQIVGDIAVQTADSVARIRSAVSEQDVTDVLSGIKSMGTRLHFSQNGRIIVSALTPVTNSNGTITNQKILWQRCSGALQQNSSYGTSGQEVGIEGMGPGSARIKATANTNVIVVEVRYRYQPIISQALIGGQRTQSAIAAMVVREREDIAIGSTGTASSCSTYSA